MTSKTLYAILTTTDGAPRLACRGAKPFISTDKKEAERHADFLKTSFPDCTYTVVTIAPSAYTGKVVKDHDFGEPMRPVKTKTVKKKKEAAAHANPGSAGF